MTKAELVEHVATTVQLPKHQIDAVLTRCLQGIMDVVHKGNTIELRGFGRFRLRHRPARTGRNPRTGDMLYMPAKAVPAFTVGQAFQALVQPVQHLHVMPMTLMLASRRRLTRHQAREKLPYGEESSRATALSPL
jgi:nucleoid DNA-binding protein